MSAPVVVRDLHVRYGRTPALDGLSLTCDSGVTALAGSNGAGKSTLLSVLATLIRPTSGAVEIDGLAAVGIRGRRHARSRIGYVPQRPDFNATFTVDEAVAYAAWLHRIPRGERARCIDGALTATDLQPWRSHQLRALSGGTLQRVFIAQAVVHEPQIVLLDEATVGVDAEHRVGLRALIKELARDRVVLLSTHQTEDLELLAERIVVLNEGHIVFDDAPDVLSTLSSPDAGERAVEAGLRSLAAQQSAGHAA